MKTYVSAIASGMGDVLISLPAIQALIDKGENVVLVTRSLRQSGIAERVAGLKGEISEMDLNLQPGDRYINLRDHPLQTEHIWDTPEFEKFFGPTNIEKIITKIAYDFGIEADYEQLRPLYAERVDLAPRTVAVVPGTDLIYKRWPHEYWLELVDRLKDLNLKVVLLGKPDESQAVAGLKNAGVEWLETKTIAEAIDIISSCAAVISVDTGLMHIGVQQNVPTYCFVHPIHKKYFRSAPNYFKFLGRNCPIECGRDFELKPGFQQASLLPNELKIDAQECSLPNVENCMAGIRPDIVFELIKTHQSVRGG